MSQRLRPVPATVPIEPAAAPPPVDPAPYDIPPRFDAPAARPSNGNRSLLISYGAACAALLLVLVGLAIYGFVIKKAPEVQLSTPEITTEAPQDSGPRNWRDPPRPSTESPATESPTAAPAPSPAGAVADRPRSSSALGMASASISDLDDAPL